MSEVPTHGWPIVKRVGDFYDTERHFLPVGSLGFGQTKWLREETTFSPPPKPISEPGLTQLDP